MHVSRAEFLQQLEAVQPGLSPREIVEQSSCFAFKNGYVFTFNDEVACRAKSMLDKEIIGAVQAKQLLDLLRKHDKDDYVDVEFVGGEMLLKGKTKWRAGIRTEAEIMLPIDTVEKPENWAPLHEDFNDAVTIVQECAGKDESQFALTCIRVHPKWLEACDNFQLTRYKLPTGVEKSFLVRRDSLKHIVALDMTEFAETASWVHFRNPAKLLLSCRRYMEDYPDLNQLLKVEGSPATLPKTLGDAAEKAEIFSSENADSNQVLVQLRTGKMRVKGIGASGWYQKIVPLKYDGEPMEFMVAPKLLVELTKRHLECTISPERLLVNGGKFRYVTCLHKVEDNHHKEEENGDGGDSD